MTFNRKEQTLLLLSRQFRVSDGWIDSFSHRGVNVLEVKEEEKTCHFLSISFVSEPQNRKMG